MSELPEGAEKIETKKDKKYSLCTCGFSNVMPYCDGKHREANKKGCNYRSLKIVADKDVELTVYSASWNS